MTSTGLNDEIRSKMEMLASGELDPGSVADWATEVMSSDQDELMNRRIWNALDQLAGADLMTAPGVLLHGPVDFSAWLHEFDEAAG